MDVVGVDVVADYVEALNRREFVSHEPRVTEMLTGAADGEFRATTASAEICKIALNCFMTTKIAYANMVGDVASRTPDADADAILQAIGTDRSNRTHASLMANALATQPRVTFSDVAYKPGCPVPIIEESQLLAVAKMLADCGHDIVVHDRQMIIECVEREYGSIFSYKTE